MGSRGQKGVFDASLKKKQKTNQLRGTQFLYRSLEIKMQIATQTSNETNQIDEWINLTNQD